MKRWPALKAQVLQTGRDNKIVFIRLVVGFVFMSEGMQKFLFLNVLGPAFFEEVGFAHGYFWAYFTGTFELACGLLVLLGLFTRLAAIPLLTIMMVAFKATKMPLLATKGFWEFAHEYNIDLSMTVLLILLLVYGWGTWSMDSKLAPAPAP